MGRFFSTDGSRKVNPRTIVLFLSLVIFIILFALIFGDKGLFEIIKKEREINRLKDQIEYLREQKRELIQQIIQLKDDPYALEKIAREELWLMKKNERVIVIEPAPATGKEKKPKEE